MEDVTSTVSRGFLRAAAEDASEGRTQSGGKVCSAIPNPGGPLCRRSAVARHIRGRSRSRSRSEKRSEHNLIWGPPMEEGPEPPAFSPVPVGVCGRFGGLSRLGPPLRPDPTAVAPVSGQPDDLSNERMSGLVTVFVAWYGTAGAIEEWICPATSGSFAASDSSDVRAWLGASERAVGGTSRPVGGRSRGRSRPARA